MNTDKRRFSFGIYHLPFTIKLSVFVCVHLWAIFLLSCQSKPTDLRALAPADAIVYMETNDLRKTLESVTKNQAFQELAKEKTDFSALENVQFAVAVTGFETSEEEISGEQSILNFKPHFVAVADTHAWKFNAVSIAETQIGKFARDAYGDDVKLEKSEKADAKFFVWTNSASERKIFAAVSHSIIYVGNDESLIDKCLSVERGEAENLLKNENLSRVRENAKSENQIAFGYISPEGVAQIANLAGVSTAAAAENSDERNFIAGILRQILKNSVKEVSWNSTRIENGIEDKIFISTGSEVSAILNDAIKTSQISQTNSAEFLPFDVFSATRYNLQNSQTSWRGLLSVIAKQSDAASGNILTQFSDSLLEPYGIQNADVFLSAVENDILTAQFDEQGKKSIAVFNIKNAEAVKKSTAEINFKSKPEKLSGAEIWKSEDGETSAAFVGNKLILGDAESVLKCLEAKESGQNFIKNQHFQAFDASRAASVTFLKDTETAGNVVAILSEAKDENKNITTVSLTETRFTEKGIERKSVSAFGLIGTILQQVKSEK